jgi:hypothetical protein
MRQAEKPFVAVFDRLFAFGAADDQTAERAFEAVLDMYSTMRLGTMRMNAFSLQAPAESVSASLDSITLSGLSTEGLDSFLLNGFRFGAPAAFGSLDKFEIAGFVAPDVRKLMAFAALEDDAKPEASAEVVLDSFAALPRLAHVGLTGLKAGMSEAEAVTLGAFSLDFGDWNEVYARSTDFRIEALQIPRSLMKLDAETARIMDTLAIDPMVFGMSMSDRWSPETGADNGVWSFSLRDAADVEFSYTLTGLTMDWVTRAIAAAGKSEDREAALIAMYSDLALQGATLKVTDRSLLDRAFAVAAQKQNLTVDGPAYRAQMRGALPFLLSAAVPAELSKLLTAPLQAFMEGGKTLIAEIAPPAPIPLPELVAASSRDPTAIPGFLGLTLRSE